MPDLAVVFDPSGSLDAPSVAGRLEGVLEAGNARFKTARVLDPCIAAVNVLKRFSFAPDQPLRDEDGNGDAWMMVDGALFHKGGADKALNDLRVGLRSQDEKALFALNGQFNGIKYIPSEKRLVIVTDRLGSRPLYHSCEGGKHVIASEMKAVVAAAGRPVALDHLGVLELFAFGHNLGSRTVLERINVLPPGSVVTIDEKGLRTSSYFKYRYQPLTENASSAFCGEGLAEAVRESMPLYLEGSARKCIFLSGGLDSRIIAASIDTDRYHVDAVTFGYPEARDVRYAARLSELLGFEHQIMTYPRVYLSKVIRRVVERTECATAFHHSTSVLFHDEIAKRAESILVGFCGDVFSGGHLRPGMFSTRPGSGLAGMLFDRALCGSVKEVSRIFRDDVFKSLWSGLDAAFRESVNSIQDQAGHDVADVWDVVNRQRRFTFSAPKVDRRRFEVVAPLLDNRFVEQVLSLPASARKGQAAYRHAIVTGFPLISGVPWTATGRPIRLNRAADRAEEAARLGIKACRLALSKLGLFGSGLGWRFRDIGEEMRNDPELFDGHLFPFLEGPRFPEELFDRKAVMELVKDHMGRKKDASHLLSTLLTVGEFLDLCSEWVKRERKAHGGT